MNKLTSYIQFILWAMLSLSMLSCRNRTNSETGTSQHAEAAGASLRQFPSVTPPAMLQEAEEIFEYLTLHFWDQFFASQDFLSDSLHVAGVEMGELEQNFSNYIYVLENVPYKTACEGMKSLADKIESCESADTSSNIFDSFVKIADKYLFDPNSPMRNEDLYQPFAEKLSGSAHLNQAVKDRYAYVSEMCSLNKVGTKAADFRFCDRKGRSHTLYGIKADYTLLFFSNPGCASCLEIINSLKADQKVTQMIADRALSVLNIYIDEDLQGWRDYMPIYPEEWYNGFDPDLVIRTDKIYNVRAIPSLYLLDKNKTVLLKDATPEKLFAYISRI